MRSFFVKDLFGRRMFVDELSGLGGGVGEEGRYRYEYEFSDGLEDGYGYGYGYGSSVGGIRYWFRDGCSAGYVGIGDERRYGGAALSDREDIMICSVRRRS